MEFLHKNHLTVSRFGHWYPASVDIARWLLKTPDGTEDTPGNTTNFTRILTCIGIFYDILTDAVIPSDGLLPSHIFSLEISIGIESSPSSNDLAHLPPDNLMTAATFTLPFFNTIPLFKSSKKNGKSRGTTNKCSRLTWRHDLPQRTSHSSWSVPQFDPHSFVQISEGRTLPFVGDSLISSMYWAVWTCMIYPERISWSWCEWFASVSVRRIRTEYGMLWFYCTGSFQFSDCRRLHHPSFTYMVGVSIICLNVEKSPLQGKTGSSLWYFRRANTGLSIIPLCVFLVLVGVPYCRIEHPQHD